MMESHEKNTHAFCHIDQVYPFVHNIQHSLNTNNTRCFKPCQSFAMVIQQL